MCADNAVQNMSPGATVTEFEQSSRHLFGQLQKLSSATQFGREANYQRPIPCTHHAGHRVF